MIGRTREVGKKEDDRGMSKSQDTGQKKTMKEKGSPSGFQRQGLPGRADRKYRVAHQIFRRERPRVMAARPPDEAQRIIGMEKEKDTVEMSTERKRGREREI